VTILLYFGLIFAFYIVPIVIVFIISHNSNDFELNNRGMVIHLIPLVAIISLVIIAASIIKDWWDDNGFEFTIIDNVKESLRERKIRKEKRKRDLEERLRKIKLGIIKISPQDPYGEENWD